MGVGYSNRMLNSIQGHDTATKRCSRFCAGTASRLPSSDRSSRAIEYFSMGQFPDWVIAYFGLFSSPPALQIITHLVRMLPPPRAWIVARPGHAKPQCFDDSRDSKNDSIFGARHEIQRRRRHAPSCMGATELQSNWPEMRKTLGKPGFCSKGFRKLTERTGTEQLGVFPTFLRSSRGVLRQDSARPKFGSVDDQATTIGAMTMNQFRDSVAGYCQDWVLYAPVVPGRLN